MRFNEVKEVLSRVPFEPFRIQLSNGRSYEVRHPQFAGLTRHCLYVGMASEDDEVPDRMVQCDLLHIATVEPINGHRN